MPTSLKLFAASVLAWKVDSVQHTPFTIAAINADRARDKTFRLSYVIYPFAEGWVDHDVVVTASDMVVGLSDDEGSSVLYSG